MNNKELAINALYQAANIINNYPNCWDFDVDGIPEQVTGAKACTFGWVTYRLKALGADIDLDDDYVNGKFEAGEFYIAKVLGEDVWKWMDRNYPGWTCERKKSVDGLRGLATKLDLRRAPKEAPSDEYYKLIRETKEIADRLTKLRDRTPVIVIGNLESARGQMTSTISKLNEIMDKLRDERPKPVKPKYRDCVCGRESSGIDIKLLSARTPYCRVEISSKDCSRSGCTWSTKHSLKMDAHLVTNAKDAWNNAPRG